MKEILVNNEGYSQFFEELEKLKNSLVSNASSGSEAYNDAVGDGWHDNFAYEEVMRQERGITNKINDMIKQKPFLKIIEDEEYIEDIVNINDIVEVLIKYSEDDAEKEHLKLTGKYSPNTNDINGIKEISLNSPIGKAIYKKKINSSAFYDVGKNKIEVFICRKISN